MERQKDCRSVGAENTQTVNLKIYYLQDTSSPTHFWIDEMKYRTMRQEPNTRGWSDGL